MPKKKKKMNPKLRKFLNVLFGFGNNWKDIKSFGGKLVLNLGWYQGHTFRIFSIKFGDLLWDNEIGFFTFFEIMIAHLSLSLTLYPYEESTGDGY